VRCPSTGAGVEGTGETTKRRRAAGLAEARRRREFSGLHRLHRVFVLGSLLVTLGAWQYAAHTLEERNRLRFDRQADQVAEQLRERLNAHASLLRATVGFIEASGDTDRQRWQAYAAALDLQQRYPELNGLAVARLVTVGQLDAFLEAERAVQPGFTLRPPHDDGYHLPIVMATPATLERRVGGYDVAFEAERRQTLDRAFTTDGVSLTSPVQLVGSGQPGVVMVAPYRLARSGRAGPGGAVVTSMLFTKLMRADLAPGRRTIRLRISDARQTMLDELGDRSDTALDPDPMFETRRTLDVYGRDWQLDMQSTRGFRAGAGTATPWLVLLFGLGIDALLITLLWLHGRAGRRLLDSTQLLSRERLALANSNERLENFACIVSHDLRAPLIGLRCLIDVVEDDLRDGIDVATPLSHLEEMRRRIERADAMIEGVMAYSELDAPRRTLVDTDLGELVMQIGATLGVEDGRLVVTGRTPPWRTDRVRLAQVLENLIGNAFKYHHDPATAFVRVALEHIDDDWVRVSVIDNGGGIDPEVGERVFEPFVTAHGTDRDDSNGIGLAIVRRAIESLGGTIALGATPGGGTTIVFTWPRRIDLDTAPATTVRPGGGNGPGPALPIAA